MDYKYIQQVLVAIQTDIVAKNLEGAFGRCAILWRMFEDENKLKEDLKK